MKAGVVRAADRNLRVKRVLECCNAFLRVVPFWFLIRGGQSHPSKLLCAPRQTDLVMCCFVDFVLDAFFNVFFRRFFLRCFPF